MLFKSSSVIVITLQNTEKMRENSPTITNKLMKSNLVKVKAIIDKGLQSSEGSPLSVLHQKAAYVVTSSKGQHPF
jgi:hypothetical protein